MSRFLLDTDILIDFSKGYEPGHTFVFRAITNGDELGVTAIALAEFYSGVAPVDLPIWDAFFRELEHWAITPEAARQAGRWRYDSARRGRQLPTTDTIVAAVALEQHAVIVTKNVRDYPLSEVDLLTPSP